MREYMEQNLDPIAGRQAATGRLGSLWCGLMHDSPMWPIHGRYECRTCGRHYPVPWTENRRMPIAPAHVRPAPFPSALLQIVILLAFVLASPVQAADVRMAESTVGPSMAFARYTASLEHASPWILEIVEIDASLPRLEKAGRLRAIRHLLPVGRPEYEVLEMAGDRTVRQQVIVRYLSADVRAAAIPGSSVAITPANYRFRFKGPVKTGERVAYAFVITPRKKRAGLIKGELWLDGETGAVVRQSGSLVKMPSIFVKRVDLTRETFMRDGVAAMRITHMSIDTRLVGRAELTILEQPCTASGEDLPPVIAER